MSVTGKSIVFLALTFAVSWGVAIGAWALGAADNPLSAWAALTGMMTGPAIAATICAVTFEKRRRLEALGLRFRPNWWWLFGYLIALALGAASVLATLIFSDRTLGDITANTLRAVEEAGQDTTQIRTLGANLVPAMLVQALLLGALLNSIILTFTEELGWRGYLHGLWRRFGFWRSSLATGVIWGVWHAPAIYLYGLNYPENRVLGLGLFVVFCALLAPIMTLVRDHGRSVFAAGILHGSINAVGGLTILALSNADFPWTGAVGIGGFAALALGVAMTALLQARGARAPAAQLAAT